MFLVALDFLSLTTLRFKIFKSFEFWGGFSSTFPFTSTTNPSSLSWFFVSQGEITGSSAKCTRTMAYLLYLRRQTEVRQPVSQGFRSKYSHLFNMCTSTCPGKTYTWRMDSWGDCLLSALNPLYRPLRSPSRSYTRAHAHTQTHPSWTTSIVPAPCVTGSIRGRFFFPPHSYTLF